MSPAGERSDPARARLAGVALAFQCLFLGFNWVVMKVGLRYSDLWPFVGLRAGLGAFVLVLLLLILRRPFRPQVLGLTVVLGLLQTTAQTGLLMWALALGSAGRTSALVYIMPFWTMLFAWVFLGERISGWQWPAAALALAGLVCILDPAHLGGTVASKVLAIAGGMSWAGGNIVAKKIHQGRRIDVLNLTTWQMVFGAVPLVIIALVVPGHHVEWNLPFVGALTYNIFLATAIAWVLWLFVLQVLPAGVAGVGTLASPVIGVSGSALLLGERFQGLEVAGVALVLVSLLLLTMRGLLQRRSISRLTALHGEVSSGRAVTAAAGPVSPPGRGAARLVQPATSPELEGASPAGPAPECEPAAEPACLLPREDAEPPEAGSGAGPEGDEASPAGPGSSRPDA